MPTSITKAATIVDITFRRSSTWANSSLTCCIFLFYIHRRSLAQFTTDFWVIIQMSFILQTVSGKITN